MYVGNFQLGKYLNVMLQCTDANRVKTMPDYVPLMKVRIGTLLVKSAEMPLVDKNIQVGLFSYPLFLGEGFSVGHGTVEMFYRVGAKIADIRDHGGRKRRGASDGDARLRQTQRQLHRVQYGIRKDFFREES